MKNKYTLLIVSILIPITVGLLASVFALNGMKEFVNVNKPSLSPRNASKCKEGIL